MKVKEEEKPDRAERAKREEEPSRTKRTRREDEYDRTKRVKREEEPDRTRRARREDDFDRTKRVRKEDGAGRTSDVKKKDEAGPAEEEKREVPNFVPSGKLTAETNTYKGVVIKYNEPPEAKICKTRWRIYPFKGKEQLPIIYVHRQSAYLIGRERKIADFPVDHPSCSKQHAVLQYRSMPCTRSDGSQARRTLPYIIDLGSANGTYLNGERIEAERYYELKEQDVLKFGFSTREYVFLKEISEDAKDEDEDDIDDQDVDFSTEIEPDVA